MFWNGNYASCHIDTLLGNENVSLYELMQEEAILQECKSQNKKLIEFLIRRSTLQELVTLITEEPPENMDLRNRYRYASLACEIMTSDIPVLGDRLSADSQLMDRLCSFVDRPPPLNPLLASFFSKAIEMLLSKKTEQDCYTHQMTCLRVLEHFKNRPSFLPALLMNIGTSAIMDTLRHMILVDPEVRKNMIEDVGLVEHPWLSSGLRLYRKVYSKARNAISVRDSFARWLESQGCIEQLIQILCGTHKTVSFCPIRPIPWVIEDEVLPDTTTDDDETATHLNSTDKADNCSTADADAGDEQVEAPKTESEPETEVAEKAEVRPNKNEEDDKERMAVMRRRLLSYQSANASQLLSDIIQSGELLHRENLSQSIQMQQIGVNDLHSKLDIKNQESENIINLLLESIFTTPPETRYIALVNGIQVLISLSNDMTNVGEEMGNGDGIERQRAAKAVAPHLPLLHQALLIAPSHTMAPCAHIPEAVGEARLAITKLIPELLKLENLEIAEVLIALGTFGLMLDMFFKHRWNNFLHANVERTISLAIFSKVAGPLYLKHLIFECNLIDRLITVWDNNEKKECERTTRHGYMGHVILILSGLHKLLENDPDLLDAIRVPEELKNRWQAFVQNNFLPVLEQHSGFLGGIHPAHQDFNNDKYTDFNEYEEAVFTSELGGNRNIDFQDMGDKENDNDEANEDMFALACSQRNMDIDGDDDHLTDKYWELEESSKDKWEEEELIKNLEVTSLILESDSPWASAEDTNQEDDSGWAHFELLNLLDKQPKQPTVGKSLDNFGESNIEDLQKNVVPEVSASFVPAENSSANSQQSEKEETTPPSQPTADQIEPVDSKPIEDTPVALDNSSRVESDNAENNSPRESSSRADAVSVDNTPSTADAPANAETSAAVDDNANPSSESDVSGGNDS